MGLFDKLKGKIKETVKEQLTDSRTPEVEKKEEVIPTDVSENESENDRPETVPATAIWNDDNDEWEVGERDENGVTVGEWKWWREDGTLCCVTHFEEGSMARNFTFERFHEDGTYAQKGAYVNGVQHGTFYYQGSENYTSERVLEQAPAENIFRFEFDWENGSVVGTRQWDADNNELNQKGNPLNMKRPESVDEAAVFNEEHNEYQLEQHNEFGEPIGTHKYWRANGAIFEELEYKNGSKISQRQFHPSGNLAVEFLYQPNCTTFTSRVLIDEANSDIEFNRNGLADNVVKKEYLFDNLGFMIAWKGFDANGKVVVEEEINVNTSGRIPQLDFDSVEEASTSWNNRGEQFFKDMNHFVDQYYVEGHPEVSYEPQDERVDMEKYMIHQIIKMNKAGQMNELHEQFKPSINAFSNEFWMSSGKNVSNVVATNDATYVTLENEVYKMTDDGYELVKNAMYVGISKSQKHLLFCENEGVIVREISTGNISFSLKYPTTYGEAIANEVPHLNNKALASTDQLGISGVELCFDEKAIVLATKRGTFILNQNDSKCIFPTVEQLKHEVGQNDSVLSLVNNYCSISATGDYLNCTAAFKSGHEYTSVFKIDSTTNEAKCFRTDVEQNMYITTSIFDHNNSLIQGRFQGPDGYGRGDVTYLLGIPENSFNSEGEGIVTDETPSLFNFMGEVQQLAYWQDQLYSATSKKYIWSNFVPGSEGGVNYCFLGGDLNYGKVSSMSVSPDGKSMVIATNYGCVFKFSPSEEMEARKNHVSNMNVSSDKLFLFLHGESPLIW